MPSRPLTILWSNDNYLAVAKPAGLAVIPGRGEAANLLELLSAQLGLPATGSADARLRVVHRLDKDTTGVLLLATDSQAQRHVSRQFQNNSVHKEYLALVRGSPEGNEGAIDAPIAEHPTSPRRMALVRHGGRPARTLWTVEQRFRGFTLLRVFPKTGKTHQIRVHLRSIGLPLAIDPLYNPPHGTAPGLFLSSFKRDYRSSSGGPERPLIDRLTLHAHRLRFVDLAGTTIEVEAPIPKDFRAALNMLSKYASR